MSGVTKKADAARILLAWPCQHMEVSVMGIFTRIGEIINANISSMLEGAEHPEKMIRLMIHEMEDTLTEVKSSAAEVVAERIRMERALKEITASIQEWQARAELALSKDRDDLAREALERKLMYEARIGEATERLALAQEGVLQYQNDIGHLEEKLKNAYRRQKELSTKMNRARNRQKVQEKLYRVNSSGAFERFETYSGHLDRMEADLEVNQDSLSDRFRELEHENSVEAELKKLRKATHKK